MVLWFDINHVTSIQWRCVTLLLGWNLLVFPFHISGSCLFPLSLSPPYLPEFVIRCTNSDNHGALPIDWSDTVLKEVSAELYWPILLLSQAESKGAHLCTFHCWIAWGNGTGKWGGVIQVTQAWGRAWLGHSAQVYLWSSYRLNLSGHRCFQPQNGVANNTYLLTCHTVKRSSDVSFHCCLSSIVQTLESASLHSNGSP